MPIRLTTCAFVWFYTEYITFQTLPATYAASAGRGTKHSPVPPLQSCETMRSVSDENVTVRDRSGSGKGLPAAGAYLRISGPSGPLTGVYEGRTVFLSAPMI